MNKNTAVKVVYIQQYLSNTNNSSYTLILCMTAYIYGKLIKVLLI